MFTIIVRINSCRALSKSMESEFILAVAIPCGLVNGVSSMEREETKSEVILSVGEMREGGPLGGKRGSSNPGGSRLLVGRNGSEMGRGGIKRA